MANRNTNNTYKTFKGQVLSRIWIQRGELRAFSARQKLLPTELISSIYPEGYDGITLIPVKGILWNLKVSEQGNLFGNRITLGGMPGEGFTISNVNLLLNGWDELLKGINAIEVWTYVQPALAVANLKLELGEVPKLPKLKVGKLK